MGVLGNERADQLAKAGSLLPQTDSKLTFPETTTLIRSIFKTKWTASNKGYRPEQDSVRKLDRANQTIIHRLRTGHCALKAHLHKIGLSNTADCPCNHGRQTPSHILQECPLYDSQRRHFWPTPEDINSKLWGNLEDLAKTSGFAMSLGISV